MSKRWIKYISFILSAVLFSGCIGAVEKNNGKIQKVSKAEEKQQQAETKSEEESATAKVLKGEMKGNISISVMESTPFLENAVKKFKEKYPDVEVKINFFSTPVITEMPGGMVLAQSDPDPNKSFDKYVMTLNTAFMNGQGDDIISTVGLPLMKYVESGYLENLKPYLNEENGFVPDDYRMNIVQAMQIKDGIYTMPISYNLKLISLNSRMLDKAEMDNSLFNDKVWTFSKMTAFYKAFKEKTSQPCYMLTDSGNQLFFELLEVNAHKWIDVLNKKVYLDSKEFVELLEQCKAFEEEGYIPKSSTKRTTEMYENSLFSVLDTLSPMIYNGDFYESEDKHIDYRVLSDEEKQININAYQNFAVNAASTNKYVAFEFVKFLLSEEIQKEPSVRLPLNKNAFEVQAKQTIGEMVEGMPKWGSEVKATEEDILQDYIKHINEWSEMAGHCSLVPTEIKQVVAEEANAFFKGEQSAEEAAKNAQNKVYMMLNE